MKLTRSQLKKLIESYLHEQEDEGAPPDDETVTDDEGAPPVEEEPAGEDAAEEEPVEEEPVEEEPVEEEPGLPDKFKSYELVIGDDPNKYKIQFLKDTAANVLKVSVNGSSIQNPTKQDFVTLAAYGLIGVEDEELQDHLSTIVKQDQTFKKFEKAEDVKSQVLNKMKGSRQGFTKQDVMKSISKAG